MIDTPQRPLQVFLCHASANKPTVRKLYQHLTADGVDAWLDDEKLIPGQQWQIEIPKAVRNADVVIICLSQKSINKEGYVQKEIKFALDIADEKPEGTIFIVPARLEDCKVPERLSAYQWVDLFDSKGYEKLMQALQLRADNIGATFSYFYLPFDPDSWATFQNMKYRFEFEYPRDIEFANEDDDYVRFDLPFRPGTNLNEKRLSVSAKVIEQPLPISDIAQEVVINNIIFREERGGDAAAGTIGSWWILSTTKDTVEVNFHLLFLSSNIGAYSIPPPEYNGPSEEKIFLDIVSTFRWLDQ